jgi:two-component system LytT family response regulator
MMIRAIIVDDEPLCCKSLDLLVEQNCSDVRVIGIYGHGEAALEALRRDRVDLVFLDVEMPGMSGFEMLEHLTYIDFKIVFTTSHDRYALAAFRVSAMDYLLKPIDRLELMRAVEKVKENSSTSLQQLEILLQKARQPSVPVHKLALPSVTGLEMIPTARIMYIESSDNYTYLTLKGGTRMLVTRSLKDMEDMLDGLPFVRVHRGYIANLNEIERYVRGDGGYVMMSDGCMIDVSRSRKEALLQKLLR